MWLADGNFPQDLQGDNLGPSTIPFNGGVCEGAPFYNVVNASCQVAHLEGIDFLSFEGNTLYIDDTMITSEDHGQWVLEMQVTYDRELNGELEQFTERRGFVLSINYFDNSDQLLASGIPVLSMASFSGTIEDTWMPEN